MPSQLGRGITKKRPMVNADCQNISLELMCVLVLPLFYLFFIKDSFFLLAEMQYVLKEEEIEQS